MSQELVIPLQKARQRESAGNKARQLAFLARRGFPIPRTVVCTAEAYLGYRAGDDVRPALRRELAPWVDGSRRYAVRSSANLEDSLATSFAGQFKSVLYVQGLDEVLAAIEAIWAATRSEGVQAYLERHEVDPTALRMAVLVQEMVDPRVSGVAFSKNPLTGLSEVIVEAVEGDGQLLMQAGVTPARWVQKWGTWIERPAETAIAPEVIDQVAAGTKAIARAYGRPVDLEWVYDGRALSWVQLREITALNLDVYSNRISSEMFPGIIKPLIWSVNIPLVNGAWVALFTELIGPNDLDPNRLAKSFYHRAYFNMGAVGDVMALMGLPRETLELMLGIEAEGPEKPSFKPSRKTYGLLPRLLWAAASKARFGRRVEAFVPVARERFRAFHDADVGRLDGRALLGELDRLLALAGETAYYNIVTPLLMQLYNGLLRGRLRRLGIDFETLDLTRGMEGLAEFDPNPALAAAKQRYDDLDPHVQERIGDKGVEALRELDRDDPFRRAVDGLIEGFGHLSDSGNDFSAVPWRENLDLVLATIAAYVPPEGGGEKLGWEDLALPPLRRWLLRPIYERARRFRLYREAISSLYTYGYGLLRIYFLALADRLVEGGVMGAREEIFYLTEGEVRAAVNGELGAEACRTLVGRRRQEIEAVRDVQLPATIYGDEEVPLAAGSAEVLRGTPTSRGVYSGPVRVVRGLGDFGRVRPGDVLVVPFSDVGWTPLFSRAGAVVAQSGGLLSHSSIVAREYGIPAVVSVANACELEDGTVVTVDGYRGEVAIGG
jgi:phosphohistidine swiveling domain-containing protein